MEIMTRVTAIRVSSDIYSRVKDISERQDLSISAVLRAIIVNGLDEASEAGPELLTTYQTVKHRRRYSSPAKANASNAVPEE